MRENLMSHGIPEESANETSEAIFEIPEARTMIFLECTGSVQQIIIR